MSRGQILRGQMSLWQIESVLDVPRNLHVKFHQIRVSNSWDIADIEFLWWVCGWSSQSHFLVKPNRCVEVRLGWGFDNYKSEYEMIDQCPGLIMQIQVVIFIFRFPSKISNFHLTENVSYMALLRFWWGFPYTLLNNHIWTTRLLSSKRPASYLHVSTAVWS